MIDLKAKLEAVAEIIEGRVVSDSTLPVCVKGAVLGFPATLQALSPNWPFGVSYCIETEVVDDPNRPARESVLKMTLYPRLGRGLMGFITHVLLFESKGMPVPDKRLSGKFVFSYNDSDLAERFVKYPGVGEKLLALEEHSRFSEMTIKSDAGLVLSQPKSFNALDLDVCRATFRELAEIGQVLFEAF